MAWLLTTVQSGSDDVQSLCYFGDKFLNKNLPLEAETLASGLNVVTKYTGFAATFFFKGVIATSQGVKKAKQHS